MDISSRCGGATSDFTSLSVHKRRLFRQQLWRFLLGTLQECMRVPCIDCHPTRRTHDGITPAFAPAAWRGRHMRSILRRRQAGTYLPSCLRLSSQAHPLPGLPQCHPTAKTRRLDASVRTCIIHVDWRCTKILSCSSPSSHHHFWLPGPGPNPHR